MSVYISGTGIISPLGLNDQENFRSVSDGKTGIHFSDLYGQMIGSASLSNDELISMHNLKKGDYSRTTLLSLHAAYGAWGNNHHFPNVRTGMVSGTSVGGLDRIEDYYFRSKSDPSTHYYERMIFENGGITETVAAELGISGHINTISTACSSSANSIMQGGRLIEAGKADRLVVGGCDALARFDVEGFSSLKIYDEETCRPFDKKRRGLNLGEGAAYLLLENEHSLSVTGNTPLCRLTGWNNSADAFHQTASSEKGTGSVLTMKMAIDKACLNTADISYINAHGTGTPNNDLSESIAIKSVFGEEIPPFSSTKGYTGHTLAAAGAIEAVFCVLAITEQVIFPNINFASPMPETGLIPETTFRSNVPVEHVLSNSFGFGGNCTSLIFSER